MAMVRSRMCSRKIARTSRRSNEPTKRNLLHSVFTAWICYVSALLWIVFVVAVDVVVVVVSLSHRACRSLFSFSSLNCRKYKKKSTTTRTLILTRVGHRCIRIEAWSVARTYRIDAYVHQPIFTLAQAFGRTRTRFRWGFCYVYRFFFF